LLAGDVGSGVPGRGNTAVGVSHGGQGHWHAQGGARGCGPAAVGINGILSKGYLLRRCCVALWLLLPPGEIDPSSPPLVVSLTFQFALLPFVPLGTIQITGIYLNRVRTPD